MSNEVWEFKAIMAVASLLVEEGFDQLTPLVQAERLVDKVVSCLPSLSDLGETR